MRSFELEHAGREDVEAFIADQLARWKPATATNAIGATSHDIEDHVVLSLFAHTDRLASASRLLRYLGG
jgi:hypothetical protein